MEQALLKRHRDRNRKFLKQIRRRKLQKLRKRKPEGSLCFERPQQNLEIPDCSLPLPCYEIDPVEEAKYRKQLEESRGFDVDSFRLPYSVIGPVRVDYTEELMGKVAVHGYNYDKGTKLVFNGVTKANAQAVSLFVYYVTLEARDSENNDALVTFQTRISEAAPKGNEDFRLITEYYGIKGSGEHKYGSQWDPTAVGEFYTGLMPNWLEDDALRGRKKRQYYEVKKSDLEENEWLYLYMEVAAFAKWDSLMVDQKPLELKKVVVQTEEEDVESSMKLKSSNAIFYISFKVCGGDEYRGIIRQTRDGRPQHLCLEVVCRQVL